MMSTVVACQCPSCQQEGAPPERALYRRMNVFMSRLDEAWPCSTSRSMTSAPLGTTPSNPAQMSCLPLPRPL